MLVSIVIPCYNAEKWIALAIQSALNQTWQNKEVIVIDDGSTDRSLEIIKSFGKHIRWETGPNRGGNVARNRGLELAQGQWIQFLDGDDYLEPVKIQAQLESLQWKGESGKRQAESGKRKEVGKGQADFIYSPVKVEEWRCNEKRYYVSEVDEDLDLYSQWISWQVAQTGAVLWLTDSLRRIGGWNEAMPCCQDNELILRAIQHGLAYHYYPEAQAVYRIWSEGTVCRKDPRKVIFQKTELIKALLRWLREESKFEEKHLKYAGKVCFEMARTLASKVGIREASEYHKNLKKIDMICPSGSSFPRIYAWIYKLLGFSLTELIAQRKRYRCF